MMLGIGVHDATGGYRAYRAQTLRGIGLAEVDSQGYCFQIDLTLRTVSNGGRVAEVPITFTERARGKSKMSRAVILEALVRVARWGVAKRLGRGPAANAGLGKDAPRRGAVPSPAAPASRRQSQMSWPTTKADQLGQLRARRCGAGGSAPPSARTARRAGP